MLGFYYRAVIMGGIDKLAWCSFAISVPVSAITGPVGSFFGSHLHRQVVAGFVYVLEAIALMGFLLNKPSWQLIAIGGSIIFGGFIFFSVLSRAGKLLMDRVEKDRAKNGQIQQ